MAGQEAGVAKEGAGVGRVSTGPGEDSVPDLEPTPEPDPEPKPPGSRQDSRTARAPGCWGESATGLGGTRVKPNPGDVGASSECVGVRRW